jgi:hypothetical protein
VKKRFILVILASLFIISCASTVENSMPNWFLNQYDGTYSKNNYLCSVGAGASKEEAEENAKIALSQIFNTSIKNASVSFDNDNSSSFASRGFIDTTVDDLIGISVVNTFVDNEGLFYIRVALDKRLASNKIREIITPTNNEINSLMSESGSVYTNFQNLIRAQKLAIGIQKYFDQLSVLQNATVTSPLIKIENKIARLKETLAVRVVVNSDDEIASEQLEKVVQSMLLDSGVSINDEGALLEIDYNWSMAPPKDNLYQCNFSLKAQLFENSAVVFSLDTNSRGIGISEESAKSKAYKKAKTIIEGELF